MPSGRAFAELVDDEPAVQDSGAKPRLLSVVVPLLNEEATLGQLYTELDTALAAAGLDWEVVFVDDGSTDGSYRELVRLHAAHLNVRVVRLRRNFGKAAALAAGIEVATGEVIVTMDADLQDDPAEIPNLLAKLDDGFDVVSGWKCDRHDPFVRRFVSRIYNTATGLATGVKLHDMNCGLKAYRAEVFEHVHLYGERDEAARLPARDEIEPLVELGEQARDLRGVVLEVAVDRHHDVAGRLGEAGRERRGLAEVAAQPHDADIRGA